MTMFDRHIPDKYQFKAVSVLAGEYSAFDMADLLADVCEVAPDGRSVWQMSPMELALFAVDVYPDGAAGLQLALMDMECV